MPRLVLDASVAIAAFVPEQHSKEAQNILRQVARSGAVVPGLWPLEMAHVLITLERRKVIDGDQRLGIIEDLRTLGITLDPETPFRAWKATLDVATRHALSVYDASYLELSLRLSLPLATFDSALRHAATEASALLA